ncbi:hypothetical protein WME90_20960 [Sorangium sp. So ce375]|uniref:hypothetical protein n=1 Tax=Sorangium sp. So ce375 TaxID=3133306 RepID=UPI003F5B19BB
MVRSRWGATTAATTCAARIGPGPGTVVDRATSGNSCASGSNHASVRRSSMQPELKV